VQAPPRRRLPFEDRRNRGYFTTVNLKGIE
jgi:hypothetical protein